MARRPLTVVGAALTAAGLTTGLLAATTAHVGAVTGPGVHPISDAIQPADSAGYPANATTNDTCQAGALRGVTFQLDGGPPVATLDELGDPPAGAEVRMNWRGNDESCTGELAVLVLKASAGGTFDPADPQELLEPFAAATLDGEEGSVSLDLPSSPTCFRQIDGVVGLPLALVGGVGTPTVGNFYSGSFGGSVPRTDERDMLVDASNGAEPDCTPNGSSTTTSTTTTSTTTPPPTTAPPTTQPPPPTTQPPPTTATTVGSTPTTVVVTSATPRSIPVTGAATSWLAALAVLLIITGAIALAVSRWANPRRPQ